MTEWFRRSSDKIKTINKRDTAEGLWQKCPRCNEIIYRKELERNQFVCPMCSNHFRINSQEYFKLLLDDSGLTEIAGNIRSADPLNFIGTKKYTDQLKIAQDKTNLHDSVKTVIGFINQFRTVICVMDFSFIGGSMGSVVGERLSQAIETARIEHLPLVIITASGGARMQEGAYSLMQMAKISAKLARFSEDGGLYITILTDPTTGGTTASFAMLGDIILAEPNALIGFAGARVIKQTIGEDLPEGFQRAEFLLEKGFVDHIVQRREMKQKLSQLFEFFNYETTNFNNQ